MWKKNQSKGDTAFEIINMALLVLITIVVIYPVLHIIFASFSDPILLRQNNGLLFAPVGFTTEGYKMALSDQGIGTGYVNTIFYLTVGTAINMVTTVAGAFALSRRELYWKKLVMIFITITMFFSGGLIPWYMLVWNIGLAKSWWAPIVPFAINTWNIILMRTAFQTLPAELEEAAYMDGAGHIRTLIQIILPLSKPILAVILLYNVVGSWNSWFPAMLFLQDRRQYPLQLIIRELLIVNDTSNISQNANISSMFSLSSNYRELVKYSTIVISTLPVMMFYPFVQKYFAKGVMVGSLKG
jgi:putative aldouronate transport system permease protein